MQNRHRAWTWAQVWTGGAIVAGLICVLVVLRVYVLPGIVPLHQDSSGQFHGTGMKTYHYESGAVVLEEQYRRGDLVHSKWFRPDGSMLRETKWQNGDGVGYFLFQDGTIRVQMSFSNHIADGEAIYFNEDGTEKRRAMFRAGQEVETEANGTESE